MIVAMRNQFNKEQFDVYRHGTGEQAGILLYLESLDEDGVNRKYPAVNRNHFACPLCLTGGAMEYRTIGWDKVRP